MKILINFYAAVSEITANNLINFVTQQLANAKANKKNIEEIVIQISSGGGSSDHGLLIHNFLRQTGVPITTIGMGNVDSAAIMIYLAGDKRLAMTSCRFLLHEALTTVNGAFNSTKLKEIAGLNERITKDYCAVVAKMTGNSLKVVEKRVKEGQIISSKDAESYKIVTGIQDTPYSNFQGDWNIFIINNPQPIPPIKPNV